MKKTNIIAEAYAKRNAEIVRLYKAKLTLREISVLFDMSYERVRQIIRDAKISGVK